MLGWGHINEGHVWNLNGDINGPGTNFKTSFWDKFNPLHNYIWVFDLLSFGVFISVISYDLSVYICMCIESKQTYI